MAQAQTPIEHEIELRRVQKLAGSLGPIGKKYRQINYDATHRGLRWAVEEGRKDV